MNSGPRQAEIRPALRLPELGREPGKGIRLPRHLAVGAGVSLLVAAGVFLTLLSKFPLGEELAVPGWIGPTPSLAEGVLRSRTAASTEAGGLGRGDRLPELSSAADWSVRFPVSRPNARRIRVGDTVRFDLPASDNPASHPLLGLVVAMSPDTQGGRRGGENIEVLAELELLTRQQLSHRLQLRFPVTVRVAKAETGFSPLVRQWVAKVFSR